MAPGNNDKRNWEDEKASKPSKGNGPQGIDKAPGEEPSDNPSDLTRESQKGKKVDGDPSQFPDQPASIH